MGSIGFGTGETFAAQQVLVTRTSQVLPGTGFSASDFEFVLTNPNAFGYGCIHFGRYSQEDPLTVDEGCARFNDGGLYTMIINVSSNRAQATFLNTIVHLTYLPPDGNGRARIAFRSVICEVFNFNADGLTHTTINRKGSFMLPLKQGVLNAILYVISNTKMTYPEPLDEVLRRPVDFP